MSKNLSVTTQFHLTTFKTDELQEQYSTEGNIENTSEPEKEGDEVEEKVPKIEIQDEELKEEIKQFEEFELKDEDKNLLKIPDPTEFGSTGGGGDTKKKEEKSKSKETVKKAKKSSNKTPESIVKNIRKKEK